MFLLKAYSSSVAHFYSCSSAVLKSWNGLNEGAACLCNHPSNFRVNAVSREFLYKGALFRCTLLPFCWRGGLLKACCVQPSFHSPLAVWSQKEFLVSGGHLKQLLYLSKGCIDTLHYSTKEIQAPFLLPEMVGRVAGMLNYFLKYLTGSERRKLKISNPKEYNFNPKELLVSILEIYLHLASAGGGDDAFCSGNCR